MAMRPEARARGISLVTSSGGPAELAEAARLAERAGFESVWATEFVDRSATVALGAVADGLVGPPLFTREYGREVVRPALARGAERGGRSEPPPIAGYVTCSVGEDRGSARAAAAAIVAFNSTVKTYRATHVAGG